MVSMWPMPYGIIIPLLKDKTGDINSLDNYRAITRIPVISKLFELVVLELCTEQLMTDELQYGFKPSVGCANAIFTLRTTIDHFRDRGSTVYSAKRLIQSITVKYLKHYLKLDFPYIYYLCS